jgi:hypothetical protein
LPRHFGEIDENMVLYGQSLVVSAATRSIFVSNIIEMARTVCGVDGTWKACQVFLAGALIAMMLVNGGGVPE